MTTINDLPFATWNHLTVTTLPFYITHVLLTLPYICVLYNTCSQKTTVDIDNLPSALKDVKPTFCEACEKKGKHKMTANTYCVQCERKLCAAHEEVITDSCSLTNNMSIRGLSIFGSFLTCTESE